AGPSVPPPLRSSIATATLIVNYWLPDPLVGTLLSSDVAVNWVAEPEPVEQRLERRGRRQRRPGAPPAPEQRPGVQPRLDSPQGDRPGHVRPIGAERPAGPHFPPAPPQRAGRLPRRRPARVSWVPGSRPTSRRRRRSRPGTSAAGSPDPSAPASRPSRAPA